MDELGIAAEIDKRMPLTRRAKTTHGQRAMAMIFNGLGFMDDRLYMFPKFLENKPVARLFDQELCAQDFNDDALGRFLDAVNAYGENKLFSEIALPIALKYQLLAKSVHFDTTIPIAPSGTMGVNENYYACVYKLTCVFVSVQTY